jgi:hypothetical protein
MPNALVAESRVLAADTIVGDPVVNRQLEDLGTLEHLMIDLEKFASGQLACSRITAFSRTGIRAL